MDKKRVFIFNTVLLTVSSVLLRTSGIWFRSLITGRIGASGMGIYQLIFSIFMLGVTACTSGIGLAMTRLAAEGRGSMGCVLRCLGMALILSLAAAGFLCAGSGYIARKLIGTPAAARPLCILAGGLPLIACSACLKGYFYAQRNTVVPVLGGFLEQAATIGLSVFLMDSMPLDPLDALMLGSTLGEAASAAFLVPAFLFYTRHNPPPEKGGDLKSVLRIAGPMLAGSFFRNALYSAENILIPIGLRKNGAGGTASLAQYGVMHGMVMPILTLPLSFLSAAASLLIPEIAEAGARGDPSSVRRTAGSAFRWTLRFGFPAAAVFLVFSDDFCMLFFGSAQAGQILRIMAPIAPLMYLDNVVDNMLKGLDQQMYSMLYNLTDSLMRVALISIFIPIFGLKAYLVILFVSEIYNASLSIGRLLKVTRIDVDVTEWIVSPAVAGGFLYYALRIFRHFLP